jgi:hypothetical protein
VSHATAQPDAKRRHVNTGDTIAAQPSAQQRTVGLNGPASEMVDSIVFDDMKDENSTVNSGVRVNELDGMF